MQVTGLGEKVSLTTRNVYPQDITGAHITVFLRRLDMLRIPSTFTNLSNSSRSYDKS